MDQKYSQEMLEIVKNNIIKDTSVFEKTKKSYAIK